VFGKCNCTVREGFLACRAHSPYAPTARNGFLTGRSEVLDTRLNLSYITALHLAFLQSSSYRVHPVPFTKQQHHFPVPSLIMLPYLSAIDRVTLRRSPEAGRSIRAMTKREPRLPSWWPPIAIPYRTRCPSKDVTVRCQAAQSTSRQMAVRPHGHPPLECDIQRINL
jgi:hypothetical protein